MNVTSTSDGRWHSARRRWWHAPVLFALVAFAGSDRQACANDYEGFNECLRARTEYLSATSGEGWERSSGVGNMEYDARELCSIGGYRVRSGLAASFFISITPPAGVDRKAFYRQKDAIWSVILRWKGRATFSL